MSPAPLSSPSTSSATHKRGGRTRPASQRRVALSLTACSARARLAEPGLELRRARARAVGGESAWRGRLERYEHGDTMIVALTARAVIERPGARSQTLHYCHEAVWIDRTTAPRVLAEHLRELSVDPAVAGRLSSPPP